MTNKKPTKQLHRKKRTKGQVIKLGIQVFILIFLVTILVVVLYFYNKYGKTILRYQSEAKQSVTTSSLETFRSSQTSLVYDVDGGIIATLKSEKDVYYIEYKDIPVAVTDAMIVTEDKKFWEHEGVDYWANIRAAVALIKNKGEVKQGASTITQQLARNIFLTNEVSIERKIKEIYIAQELENKYTKEQILEFYLNNIYFANGHYGIQAASKGYFSKSVSKLSLSQMAFLCVIPNNPTIYNPITNMENTLKRRDRILLQMFEDGKIEEQDYQEALQEKIKLKQQKTQKNNYVDTYVAYCAIRELMSAGGFQFQYQFDSEKEKQEYEDAYYELYHSRQQDLYVKGYRIYTSIDMKKQELLQSSVDQALVDYKGVNEEGTYDLQGAAVCIDNDNGKVVAIVGGRNQEMAGYSLNRGYQSYRQPGSSIKPLIVYTPSFERNYTPESIVVDEKVEDGPKNSGGTYAGKMKLQRAIEVSKNTIAWKLFEELTPKVGLSYLLQMNFAKIDANDYYPAAALGGFTIGVSPVEMAAAYSTLENDGLYREPTCIIKIMDSKGVEVVGDIAIPKVVYEKNAARIMTEALTGVMKNGTGKNLRLTNTISAGKTGTTDKKKDGWFVGYTPYYTTSVWVGFDMPKELEGLAGATYPGTIWHNFMEEIHDSSKKDTFESYDWRSNLLPTEIEEDTTEEDNDKKVKEEKDKKEREEKDKKDKDKNKDGNVIEQPSGENTITGPAEEAENDGEAIKDTDPKGELIEPEGGTPTDKEEGPINDNEEEPWEYDDVDNPTNDEEGDVWEDFYEE